MDLNAQWIVGFTDGEGCFYVGIHPNLQMTQKVQVLPEFTVVQHQRDIKVLYALKEYFGCGVVRVNHGNRYCYRVRGHANLLEKILPFFEKHSLKTMKRIDFEKFRDVVLLMEKKEHLTVEGLLSIRQIQKTMNRSGSMKTQPYLSDDPERS